MVAHFILLPRRESYFCRRTRYPAVRFHAAFGLLLAGILGGCATNGPTHHPYFERLEIVALAPVPVEETDVVQGPGKSVAAGAAGGAMSALMSGAFMSLLCGPYFAVCFAGTGAATVGTATVGAVLGASTALSPEEAERVSRYLDDLQQTRNLSEELAAAVSAQLPGSRIAVPGTADARLGLEAQGLRAAPGFGDTLVLWVTAKAHLDWDLGGRNPRQASRGFVCQTEALPLEDWLSGNNTRAQQELVRCIEDVAMQVNTALQEPSSDPDPYPGLDPAAARGFGENSW